jgi:hypothetical protein
MATREKEEIPSAASASYVSSSPKPTDGQVMSFAKACGGNVGDTYRRNHDGEWRMITLGENQFAGLRNTSGSSFWPSGRVFAWITTSAEENTSDYYFNLLKRGHTEVSTGTRRWMAPAIDENAALLNVSARGPSRLATADPLRPFGFLHNGRQPRNKKVPHVKFVMSVSVSC